MTNKLQLVATAGIIAFLLIVSSLAVILSRQSQTTKTEADTMCFEGVKDIVIDKESCPQPLQQKRDDPYTGTSGTHTGSTSTTGTSSTDVWTDPYPPTEPIIVEPYAKLKGFLCWNDNEDGTYSPDEFLQRETECMPESELHRNIGEEGLLENVAQPFCKGKLSPSCGGIPPSLFPTRAPSPTMTPIPTPDPCMRLFKRMDIQTEQCTSAYGAGSGSHTGGSTTDIYTSPTTEPDVRIFGEFECGDGDTQKIDTGCIQSKDLNSVMEAIRKSVEQHCSVHKDPICYITPAISPTPSSCVSDADCPINHVCVGISPDGIEVHNVCMLQPTPTMSSLTPPRDGECYLRPRGDFNCDGVVDILDFPIFLAGFLGNDPELRADANGDGKVSLADFEIFRETFTSKAN